MDTEAMLRAWRDDPMSQGMPGDGEDVLTRSLMDLPELLGDLLDKPALLETLRRAKVVYMRRVLEDADQLRRELVAQGIDEGTADLMIESLREIIPLLEAQIPLIPQLLHDAGVTSADAIAQGPPAVRPDVLERLRGGRMTVGEVLESQPTIITCLVSQSES